MKILGILHTTRGFGWLPEVQSDPWHDRLTPRDLMKFYYRLLSKIFHGSGFNLEANFLKRDVNE